MVKKQITIADLALMVQKGFAQTATKADLKELATKAELQDLRKDMLEHFSLLEDDIRDLKTLAGPLVRIVAALKNDVRSLNIRMNRLERKVGLVK